MENVHRPDDYVIIVHVDEPVHPPALPREYAGHLTRVFQEGRRGHVSKMKELCQEAWKTTGQLQSVTNAYFQCFGFDELEKQIRSWNGLVWHTAQTSQSSLSNENFCATNIQPSKGFLLLQKGGMPTEAG